MSVKGTGIKHKKRDAKFAREKLKTMQCMLAKIEKQRDRRGQSFDRVACSRLKTDVDKMAEYSDKLSFKKGVAFTDSKGHRQCELTDQTQAHIVSLVVSMYKHMRDASVPSRGKK